MINPQLEAGDNLIMRRLDCEIVMLIAAGPVWCPQDSLVTMITECVMLTLSICHHAAPATLTHNYPPAPAGSQAKFPAHSGPYLVSIKLL